MSFTLGLVEPRATQNGAGKIETGEIETRELLAREIGRLKGCRGSDGSTSARVISADAISGDVRSTWCIISCEAPGMAEARPNIAIAPIRIGAPIIVSLYLGGCRP